MRHILLCFFALSLQLSSWAQPMLIKDIYSGSTGSMPGRFSVINNKLAFFANDSTDGYELWSSEGTGASTKLVYDINPGMADADFMLNYVKMATVGNKVYFPADDGTHGIELYSWDGANAPMLASDVHPGSTGSLFTELVALRNTIYFPTNDAAYGVELWSYNTFSGHSQIIADIHNGLLGSNPHNLVIYKNRLVFAADDGIAGNELFMYDPVSQTTSRIYDINAGPDGSDPQSLVVLNDKLYFTAISPAAGRELYVYDGTNVVRVTDIYPGPGDGIDASADGEIKIGAIGNTIYFSGTDGGGMEQQIYMYDPSTNKSSLYAIINFTESAKPSNFISYGNKLYFSANDGAHGNELWAIDGNNHNYIVYDINDSGDSDPMDMTVMNGKLYFSAYDLAYGRELYSFMDTTLSIPHVLFNGAANVYPNPATSEANITLDLQTQQTIGIKLTDIAGRIVSTAAAKMYNSGKNNIKLDMSQLSSGVYFYNLVDENGLTLYTERILKQ